MREDLAQSARPVVEGEDRGVEPLRLVGDEEPRRDPVVVVFEAWRASTKRTAATVLDAKRRRLIENALRSYPLVDVVDAVTGWQHSPYHRGENPSQRPYNDLSLLLRDASKIEDFRGFSRRARRRSGPALELNGAAMDRLL